MRGEFEALRKVARLASDYVARVGGPEFGGRDELARGATLQDLRAALSDLSRRFPYTLEPGSLAGGLHAVMHDGFGLADTQATMLGVVEQVPQEAPEQH